MSSRSRTWLAIYARAVRNMALDRSEPANPPRRILLAHHSLLGDTVMLAGCLAKLRARHPGAEIVHVMPGAFVPLFARRPFGAQAVGWSLRNPASLEALWGLGTFDLALVNGDARYSWLARAIGARRVVAFAGDRPAYKSWPVTDLAPMPSQPMAWTDLVATLVPGEPAAPYARGQWEAPPFTPFDRPAGRYAVLHVGASTMHKRWPAERWSSLARAIEKRGIVPCWSAGPGEEALVAAIPGGSAYRSYAGGLDLPQIWSLLAGAEVVVTADTSVAHIGRAAWAPTVVLYGPSGPVLGGPGRFWAACPTRDVAIDPFPCRDQDALFKRRVTWVRRCSRTVAECPAPRCMQAITEEMVLEAVASLLT